MIAQKKSNISRSSNRPPQRDDQLAQVAATISASAGPNPTLISQLMFFNITNYWWLTSINNLETVKPSQQLDETMIRLVRQVNRHCRDTDNSLRLLILPHTSTSEFGGDEIVVIPWASVAQSATAQEAVNDIMARVTEDGYDEYVIDAKIEGL